MSNKPTDIQKTSKALYQEVMNLPEVDRNAVDLNTHVIRGFIERAGVDVTDPAVMHGVLLGACLPEIAVKAMPGMPTTGPISRVVTTTTQVTVAVLIHQQKIEAQKQKKRRSGSPESPGSF